MADVVGCKVAVPATDGVEQVESLVTSRKPDDLPEFCREMLKIFGEAPQRKAA